MTFHSITGNNRPCYPSVYINILWKEKCSPSIHLSRTFKVLNKTERKSFYFCCSYCTLISVQFIEDINIIKLQYGNGTVAATNYVILPSPHRINVSLHNNFSYLFYVPSEPLYFLSIHFRLSWKRLMQYL